MTSSDSTAPPPPAVCTQCGTTVENPPMEWVLEIEPRRGRQWTCTRCARTHLRAMEAKLPQEWW